MLMKPLPDNHVFANAAEMRAHYANVHKRLYDRPQTEPQEQRIEKPVWKDVPVEQVMALVAAFYKVSVFDLCEGSQQIHPGRPTRANVGLVRVRHIAMFLAHNYSKTTMRQIGHVMGYQLNTVYEGVRKIKDRRLHDAVLYSETNTLIAQIEELNNAV